MNGIRPKRGLRDNPQLERHRGKHDRDVVDALVIGGKYVAAPGNEVLETRHRHAGAARGEDQPAPHPRALVREVAGSIDQRGKQRDGTEHDRIDRDDRDEIENSPPEMKTIWHSAHGRRQPAPWPKTARQGQSQPAVARPVRLRCSGRKSSSRPSSAARS